MSLAYTQMLKDAELLASIGSAGDSYDNAMAESTNGLYKAEVIYHKRGKTPFRCKAGHTDVGERYSNKWLQEPLGHIPSKETA